LKFFQEKNMTAKEHNKLLSIFFFIQTGLTVFGGLIAALIYGGMGTFMLTSSRTDEEQAVGGFILVVGIVAGALVVIFSAFYGFSGWKLYKEQKIGRTLGIICSCIFLLGFPLGTALGIYGLWFLLGEEGKRFYSGDYQPGVYTPPPPPQSWQ
jgi:hypothetical protein